MITTPGPTRQAVPRPTYEVVRRHVVPTISPISLVEARPGRAEMDVLAQVCTAVAAVVLIAVFPLEAFLVDRPWVQRFLGIEPHGIAHVHLWSFCIGARNALAGIGGLVGLWIVNRGDETVGTAVVVTALAYMLLSSLAMGVADLLGYWRPRGGSVRGTVASSALPAVALITLAL